MSSRLPCEFPQYAVRRQKLAAVISTYETRAAFARAGGFNAAYLYQLLHGKAAFGERAARKIEAGAGLAPGWLDNQSEAA